MNPCASDCLVIETTEIVMLGKRLNPVAHVDECSFKRLSRQMQPSQPQVIGVAKLASLQAAGVECLQKFVVT